MEKVSTARIALKWGLICALIGILYSSIAFSTELWKTWYFGMTFSVILYFTALYFAMREFKENNGSLMTFSQGLSIGTLLSATSAILGVAFDMIFKKIINPNLEVEQIEMIREQYENFGMSDEQIEEAIARVQSSTSSMGLTFIGGVFVIIFLGFLASLIMSAIMKKEKSIFD
jgi:Protein of unknown function (DUF4199)